MRPRHQSGWIEQRGTKRKYYYGCFNAYVKDEHGNEVPERRGVHLGFVSEITKSKAREKLQEEIFRVTKQGRSATDKVTLDWFWENRFKPMRSGGWSQASRDSFECDWRNYIKPKLGDLPLSKFEKFLLQTHFNELAAAEYSEWVVKRAKTLLSSVFIEAVDLDFLKANPMAKVKLPLCKVTEKPVIPRGDVIRLYIAIPALRDRLIFRIGVFLGARASELFGFTVDCWNGNDELSIRQTAWRGKLQKQQVKTRQSRRVVPVPPEMKGMLERWLAESGAKGSDLIFPGKDGESPLWPGTWQQKRVQSVAKKLGITVPVTFQVLRRSVVTRNRHRLKDVGALVGHANYETTTANVYAQSVDEDVRSMVEQDEREMGLAEIESVFEMEERKLRLMHEGAAGAVQ
jgi:integrase